MTGTSGGRRDGTWVGCGGAWVVCGGGVRRSCGTPGRSLQYLPMPIRADALPDLADYRDARRRRLSVTRALYAVDGDRAPLLPELVDLFTVARADRAAVVWVDEYGSEERVHPYAVVDLANDRPDRSFPWEPVAHAMDLGVPGLVDVGGQSPLGRRSGPLVAVALGNDWDRSWLLVASGGTPRPWLSELERERVLHIAGRICGIVLHLDLDLRAGIRGMSRPSEREPFAGQGLLADFTDGPRPEAEEELIVSRFMVARPIGVVVKEGGIFPGHLGDQIRTARREMEEGDPEPPERPAWERERPAWERERPAWEDVLRALEARDLPTLGEATLALARHADSAGHRWAFAQLASWAYDLAVASRDVATAAGAAEAMAAACAGLSDGARTRWAGAHRSLMLALEEGAGGESPVG